MTSPSSGSPAVPAVEEDDWETADLEAIVTAPPSHTKPPYSRKAFLNNLRPTAPAFQPPSSVTTKKAGKQLYDPTSGPAVSELACNSSNGLRLAERGDGINRDIDSAVSSSSRTILPPQSASLPPRPTASSSSTSAQAPSSVHPALYPSESTKSVTSASGSAPPKAILLKRPDPTTTANATVVSRPMTVLARPSPPSTQVKTFPSSSSSGLSTPVPSSISASMPSSGPSSPPAADSPMTPGQGGSGSGSGSRFNQSAIDRRDVNLAGGGVGWNGEKEERTGDDFDAWDMSRVPFERASNRQIWTAANSSSPSSSSIPTLQSGPNTPALPPSTSLRILRRGNPNDTNFNSSGASSPSSAADRERENEREKRKKTLEEREEEYRKARERIFGVSEEGVDNGRGGGATEGVAGSSGKGADGASGVMTPLTGAGPSTIEIAVAAALAAANLDLAGGLASGSAEGLSNGSGAGVRSGNTETTRGKQAERSDGLDVSDIANANADRRSQSSSRQSTPGPGSGIPTGSTNNNTNSINRKTSNNSSRRPGRGEGSTFEMLRPPPDAAYRVSARSQGTGMPLTGGGGAGGYGGLPGSSMGFAGSGGGVIRQPLGPDDLNSVGFAAAGQRFTPASMGMGQFGGAGMIGGSGVVGLGQAGLGSASDYGYGYGGTTNQYQQAAYIQQHQQAQLQLQFQQMHIQGMLTPQQMQAYAAMGGYDTPQYGQGLYGTGQPGGPSGRETSPPPPRTAYNSQGFVQSTAPTGLASSMSTEDDPAFVVQPRPGQSGYGEAAATAGPYNPQPDFPALPGTNTRPGTLSSRSSSSSGSRGGGGGAKRKPKAWGPSSRG